MKSDQEIRQSIRAAIDDCTRGIDEAPSLQFRIAQKAREEKTVERKISVRIVCIVAALLLGTMTALAAGTDNVNAMLYELWPEAARTLRPLNLSDEQAGIRLDVISAALSEDRYVVTYSLTDLEGDRIDGEIYCSPTLEILTQKKEGQVRLLSYDPEKHQAVYGANFEYVASPGITVPRGADPVCLSVSGLERNVSSVIELWPLMNGRNYNAEAVPVPAEYPAVQSFVYGAGWVFNEEDNTVPDVLNPANNLHIPLLGSIELSGIGWIDGDLHVQIHLPDNQVPAEPEGGSYHYVRYSSFVYLGDREGRNMYQDEAFNAQRARNTGGGIVWISWWDGNDMWEEMIFPVRQDEKEDYILEAESTYMRSGVEDLLQCEWQVTFPANMIRTEE